MNGAGRQDVGANGAGHYAAHQAAPELDAGAPVLRAEDVHRLNRKALLFLAGIVLLLVAAIVGMLRAVGGDGGAGSPPRAQDLVIPELPRTSMRPTSPSPVPAAPVPIVPLPSVPVPVHGVPRVGPVLPPPQHPTGPSLRDRRSASAESAQPTDPYMQAMLAGLPGVQAQDGPAPATIDATAARPIARPDTLLVRGTYIRCVLETRIVTDIPGFTSCVVTEPVYSINGRRLLLPKGSKVLGRYEAEPRGPRVAVVWDRITTPNGIDIGMASPGVDGLGGAGHPGHYSAHWGSRIGSALLVSLVSDAFKYAAAEEGPPGAVIGEGGIVVHSPYESTTARTLERLAHQALDNRRPPTVTIHQGSLLNVYVARDVDFTAVVAQL
ncbi:MAG TPA: TrbI/VirB10 family protein [Luteimonas sp.]